MMVKTYVRIGIDAHRRAGLWLDGYRRRMENLTARRGRTATGTLDRVFHRHRKRPGGAPADSQAADG